MPPAKRKKPHPRSIEALFGPRTVPKKPIKRCERGHRQSDHWRPMMGCPDCALYDAPGERIRAEQGRKEREAFSALNHTTPVMLMVETSTGRVIRHEIPPHQRQRKARGRGRRRRI